MLKELVKLIGAIVFLVVVIAGIAIMVIW